MVTIHCLWLKTPKQGVIETTILKQYWLVKLQNTQFNSCGSKMRDRWAEESDKRGDGYNVHIRKEGEQRDLGDEGDRSKK